MQANGWISLLLLFSKFGWSTYYIIITNIIFRGIFCCIYFYLKVIYIWQAWFNIYFWEGMCGQPLCLRYMWQWQVILCLPMICYTFLMISSCHFRLWHPSLCVSASLCFCAKHTRVFVTAPVYLTVQSRDMPGFVPDEVAVKAVICQALCQMKLLWRLSYVRLYDLALVLLQKQIVVHPAISHRQA